MTRTKLLIIGGLILCIFVFLWFGVLRSPSGLSEDKFVDIYVQLSIASEMFATDTTKLEEEKERIFEETKVTQNEIDDFVKRCNNKPERWAQVWKKIVERLEERRSTGSEGQDLK